MWFRNLRLYRFTETFSITPEALQEALAEHPFHPCGKLDTSRRGWSPPLGREGTEFVQAAHGYIMICSKRQEKLLPAAVINEHLEDKVLEIKTEEGRPVGRKERQTLKDEIIFSLLPQAFSKTARDFAYIAPREDLIVVNAASAKRAEDLLSQLRESLGSLKVIPLTPSSAPTQIMTEWLRTGEPPQDFTLGEDCELQAGKDSRVIRCRHQDLTAPEVANHLDSGMYVSRLALTWKDSIHFVLDDQFSIKQLKFEDTLKEQALDRDPESAAEQFDAEFAFMALELSALIGNLLKALGGPSEA
jgi:recombination associated protein RdgC